MEQHVTADAKPPSAAATGYTVPDLPVLGDSDSWLNRTALVSPQHAAGPARPIYDRRRPPVRVGLWPALSGRGRHRADRPPAGHVDATTGAGDRRPSSLPLTARAGETPSSSSG